MRSLRADPCLLFRHDGNHLNRMVKVQVFDSLIIGSEVFLDDNENWSQVFISNIRRSLSRNETLFNGLDITLNDCVTISVTQRRIIEKRVVPTTGAGSKSQRALAQYIYVNCQTDICAAIQLIAQSSETVTKDQFDTLKRTIHYLKKSDMQGLDFVKPDMATMAIVVILDALFTIAPGLKSQLGYVKLMADKKRCANTIHHSSCRYHLSSRYALAAEVHALLHIVDMGMVIKRNIKWVDEPGNWHGRLRRQQYAT